MADTGIVATGARAELKPTRTMLDLYNDYAHDVIDRRTFMERLSKYAVGGVTLAMLTEMLMPKYATALQLAADDPRIRGERIEYDSPNGAGKQGKKMGGYLVRPANARGEAAGGGDRARESRAQPAHRRCGAASSGGGLSRAGAGRALSARRLSGHGR